MENIYYSKAIPLDCSGGKKKARAYYKTLEDKARLPELTDEYISQVDSCAGLLPENVCFADFDGMQYREPIHNLIQGEDVQCRESWSCGSHGGSHITAYINEELNMKNSFSHGWCAIGVPMDYKSGKINAYETIKLNHQMYAEKRNKKGIFPFYLKGVDNLPKDKQIDFTSISEGQRVNELSKWLFTLKNFFGFTPEQCFSTVSLINKYIIAKSLDESELYSTVLNDSTFKKLQEPGTLTKKDVTLDTFKDFLNFSGITIKYNSMTKETEYYGLPPQYEISTDKANAVPIMMLDEFKQFTKNKSIAKQTIMDYIFFVADANTYNPIHEYLENGSWDGKDRFPIIYEILGVTDGLYQVFIRKWFFQCVGRCLTTH